MVRSDQHLQDSQFDRKDKSSGQEWNNAWKENHDDGKRKDQDNHSTSTVPNKDSSSTHKKIDSMKDPPIPPTLPWDQWCKDKEERIMTHQCRYSGQWHYDMDCKKHPESYHIIMSLDQ